MATENITVASRGLNLQDCHNKSEMPLLQWTGRERALLVPTPVQYVPFTLPLRVNEWMSAVREWMNERMNEWMNEWNVEYVSTVKPTRCTNVSNLFYFGMTLYMWEKMLQTVYSTFLPWCCLPFVHVVF